MDGTVFRAADLPATQAPRQPIIGPLRRLGQKLSTLALAAAERLTLPERDVPPEFYRFPPF